MQAVTIGSATDVSMITTSTRFPAADTDNMMLGFGWFKGGFTLEDATTSCTFNSVYPVSGAVDMNGGTLHLSQDLMFTNITQLKSLGSIIGNGHSIDFCTTITVLPLDLKLIKDTTISLHDDIVVTGAVTVQGDCRINDNWNTVRLGSSGKIIVDSGARLTLKNMTLEGVANLNIECVDDTGIIVLDNVHWIQTGSYAFAKGAFVFRHDVKMSGARLIFSYQSTQTSAIQRDSSLIFDYLFEFDYVPTNSMQTLITCQDCSSRIILNAATLSIEQGLQLTNGKLYISKSPTILAYDGGLPRGDGGFTVGDGLDAAHDMQIVFLDNSVINVMAGCLNYKNMAADIQVWDVNYINLHGNVALNVFEDMHFEKGGINFIQTTSLDAVQTGTLACKTDKQLYSNISGVYKSITF